MRRFTVLLACAAVVAFVAAPLQAGGPCCDKAKAVNGWCSHCDVGFMFGVQLSDEGLHKTLQGKEVEAEAISKCSGCKTADASNGRCEHCNVWFAKHHAYKSPIAQSLAVGETVGVTEIACPTCRSAAKSGTWCSGCEKGSVAGLWFKNKETYDKAKEAYATLQKAAETKCPGCAKAMLTDAECEQCKIKYKDGKPV